MRVRIFLYPCFAATATDIQHIPDPKNNTRAKTEEKTILRSETPGLPNFKLVIIKVPNKRKNAPKNHTTRSLIEVINFISYFPQIVIRLANI